MPPQLNVNMGSLTGSSASRLLRSNFNPLVLRPFVGNDGGSYITMNTGYNADGTVLYENIPTNNAALLRKDELLAIDGVVQKIARPRLKAVNHLKEKGLVKIIPNGMGKTTLYHEKSGDIGPARTTMDGIMRSQNDRPEYTSGQTPMPLTFKDFSMSLRQLSESRNGNTPFDTQTLSLAVRKVAEESEALLLGLNSSYSFGGNSVYGYCNYTGRQLKDLADPEDSGWVPKDTFDDVLDMKQKCIDHHQYGPYILYVGPKWDKKMDEDYLLTKGDLTLKGRIKQITGLEDVVTLDYLPDYDMVFVSLTEDNIREIVGMDITTVQWEEHGGMELMFKVMCIMVPEIRSDQSGQCGIVHGSVPE